MGYFASLIESRKYKRWKRHRWAIHPNDGPLYDEPEISAMPGSKINYYDLLRVEVIDDVGIIGYNFYWYIYLYDFVKEGKTITHTNYVVEKSALGEKIGFFDEPIEEKLGGKKEYLGG